MLSTIATAIEGRLKELSIFKAVEQSFNKRVFGMLPAAVFYLTVDKGVEDKPTMARDLEWEITILASSLSKDGGNADVLACVDGVRDGFTDWNPFTAGGKPLSAPRIQFAGFEELMVIYVATISMRVFPQTFK